MKFPFLSRSVLFYRQDFRLKSRCGCFRTVRHYAIPSIVHSAVYALWLRNPVFIGVPRPVCRVEIGAATKCAIKRPAKPHVSAPCRLQTALARARARINSTLVAWNTSRGLARSIGPSLDLYTFCRSARRALRLYPCCLLFCILVRPWRSRWMLRASRLQPALSPDCYSALYRPQILSSSFAYCVPVRACNG